MKLSELRKIIDDIDDERQKEEFITIQGKEMQVYKEDPEVVIEIKDFSHVIYGGVPSVNVQSIYSGFDWDSGKLIIVPTEQLTKVVNRTIKEKVQNNKFHHVWDVTYQNKENNVNVSS